MCFVLSFKQHVAFHYTMHKNTILFMLLYYKNMLEQDTQNCLREREKGGGRVYLFGRLESCKSNSNLFVCSMDNSGRFPF